MMVKVVDLVMEKFNELHDLLGSTETPGIIIIDNIDDYVVSVNGNVQDLINMHFAAAEIVGKTAKGE